MSQKEIYVNELEQQKIIEIRILIFLFAIMFFLQISMDPFPFDKSEKSTLWIITFWINFCSVIINFFFLLFSGIRIFKLHKEIDEQRNTVSVLFWICENDAAINYTTSNDQKHDAIDNCKTCGKFVNSDFRIHYIFNKKNKSRKFNKNI